MKVLLPRGSEGLCAEHVNISVWKVLRTFPLVTPAVECAGQSTGVQKQKHGMCFPRHTHTHAKVYSDLLISLKISGHKFTNDF